MHLKSSVLLPIELIGTTYESKYNNFYSRKWIQINGLVQEWRDSIANAMELRFSCTNPWKCYGVTFFLHYPSKCPSQTVSHSAQASMCYTYFLLFPTGKELHRIPVILWSHTAELRPPGVTQGCTLYNKATLGKLRQFIETENWKVCICNYVITKLPQLYNCLWFNGFYFPDQHLKITL